MTLPISHHDAVDALHKIREAVRQADLADEIENDTKEAHKEAKAVAKRLNMFARDVARAQTKPLPLFDEADGVLPGGEVPNDPPAAYPARALPARSTFDASKAEVNAAFRQPRWDEFPVAELTAPPEILEALKAMGFKTVGLLLRYREAGCVWTMIPGVDAAGADRLDAALTSGMEQFFAARGLKQPDPAPDAGGA